MTTLDPDTRRWLIEHAAPRHRQELEAVAELDPRIGQRLVEAAAQWPDLPLRDEGFIGWVAPRLPPDRDVVAAVEATHLGDLALAYGCCLGETAAITAFEREFAAEIRGAAGDATPSAREEFEQHLRELLLLPGTSRLRAYSGRGTLRSWVRITARRAYLNQARAVQRRREVAHDDARVMDDAPASDPELSYLKAHYRDAFRKAFAQAMASLTPRDRNLLRQHLVHELNIDEIGALYRVHRSTAARWVARAREAVLRYTRLHLGAQLEVDGEELQSIIRLIGSRLDITVSRHLRAESGESGAASPKKIRS